MRNQSKPVFGIVSASIILLAAAVFTGAQTNVIASRITQAIDPVNLTILQGNTHPFAQAQFDRGAAPATLPMQRMLLVLKRSAQQENALDDLMEQQQDASSPNYHHWLTPQQYGQEFGPSDQDIQTVTSWLQSQGFQVDQVSNGRTVIQFSGTAGEVQSAFHTAIHQYLVNGESRWANSSDPEIPTALTPVVAGIDSLYDFPRHAMHTTLGAVTRNRQTGRIHPVQPLFTLGGQCGVSAGCYGVGPYDFATIYNVLPLWNQTPTATDGTGVTIAIVGESDINLQDIRDFRSFFGLPANDPTVTVVGPDPGTVQGDETESDLDVEWSGAVAKGAKIDFVTSESTEASLGVDLSAQYAVDNDVAPVLSESYGICELFLGNAGNQFYNQLWQQAAAEGITVLVATGDSGSAVCDRNANSPGPAQYGLAVSGPSSTPYNVAVGGTDFNDYTNPSTYFGTNSTPPAQPTLQATVSAKSYIPETTWNNTCTNGVFGNVLGFSSNAETNCNNSQLQADGFVVVAAGSGGESNCISGDQQNPLNCTKGYAKPAWQTALTPGDGGRDLPDVSLFAAIGSPSGAFYVMCEADQVPAGYTSCDTADPQTEFLAIGGTSGSTPSFAGIMALVNQATGSRQGNANFDLYAMAAKTGASCNSTNGTGTNCQFYDTTNGTIEMPCLKSSPNCNVSNQNDSVGILSGYNTSTGYDLATGLGSVNAANLVTAWKSFVLALKGSSTTLTLTPPTGGSLTNLTHGQAVTFNTAVGAVAPATGTPSGTVALIANTGTNGQESVQSVALNGSGDGSGSTTSLPGGTYKVEGQYPGDGTFESSVSPGTSVTVNPEASKVQIAYELQNPTRGAITNPNATTAVFGTPSILRVNVTSAAADACANNAPGSTGCPTGSVTLSDGGTSLGSFALNALGYTEDQTIDLVGGTHVLGANYGGDSSFSAPSPNPTTQTLTITPVATSTDLSAPPGAAVGNIAIFDMSVPAAALVYSTIGPTGTITLYSGSTAVGTSPISGTVDPSSHLESASTSISTSALPHGQDSITAHYSGDSNYAPSTSPAAIVRVVYPSVVALTASNGSSQYGSPLTFTAEVTNSQSGAPPMTGTVSFTTDSGILGTATVSSGTAQITTSAVPGGTHTIMASYSGDSNYAPASGSVSESVARNGSATAVTASNDTLTQGQSVTFTMTVTPSTAGPELPTGNVNLAFNGSTFGSASVSAGTGQFTTTSLPVGTDQITATFGGDENYTGSTSAAITVTVNAAPTFTVTTNASTIGIPAPGQSGSATVTFTGENGFSSNGNSPLTVVCGSLPAYSSCSVSPSSVNIATNGTATATLTIMTTASSLLIPGPRAYVGIGRLRGPSGETVVATALLLLFCCGIGLGFRGRQRRWGLAFALVALTFVFANAGCGGGSGGGGGNTNPGTPVGTQTVQVSFTINGVTQAVPITVDVQ